MKFPPAKSAAQARAKRKEVMSIKKTPPCVSSSRGFSCSTPTLQGKFFFLFFFLTCVYILIFSVDSDVVFDTTSLVQQQGM